MKMAPSVPAMTSGHQTHPVIKAGHAMTQGSNIAVRHPSLPGPNMMEPRPDHAETPSGSISKNTPAGGITGGIGPSQTEKGAVQNEFVG
jgi:hypothetical protein